MSQASPAIHPDARAKCSHAMVLPITAFVLALITTALCRAVAGVSLGLFFGGVGFATLIVAPCTAGEFSIARRAIIPFVVTLGVSVTWLFALGELLTFNQWIACSLALLTYAFALQGVCSLLLDIRLNASVASAVVTLLGLLWLTWPVWLAHALLRPIGDALVAWLVPAHPLFAINAVLIHFDAWDRLPLAYSRLTVLNQDVAYALPRGVLWTTLVHAAIGAGTTSLGSIVRRKRKQITAPPPPASS